MKTKILTIFLLTPLVIWQLCMAAFAADLQTLKYPNVSVAAIKDNAMDRQYELYIKLPEGYEANPKQHYPVIYFTDGLWNLEGLSAATNYIFQDVILVGISWQIDIDSGLKEDVGEFYSRFRDYSFKPLEDAKRQEKYQLGQASKHLHFITTDVFNYVERHYRADSNNRTYFGFSMGGLFGAYALVTKPTAFNNYILGSPSIWQDGADLLALREVKSDEKIEQVNVLISVGELEKELKPHLNEFIQAIKRSDYPHIKHIEHIEIANAGHSDSSPMLSVRSINWLASLQQKEAK